MSSVVCIMCSVVGIRCSVVCIRCSAVCIRLVLSVHKVCMRCSVQTRLYLKHDKTTPNTYNTVLCVVLSVLHVVLFV